MKRILIIFFGMLLTCNLGLAKSVSCWEEIDATFNPSTVSKMTTLLGNSTTIKRVGTKILGVTFGGNGLDNINIAISNYLQNGEFYVRGRDLDASSYRSVFGFMADNDYFPSVAAKTDGTWGKSSYHRLYLIYGGSNSNTSKTIIYPILVHLHYVHTYCIVDEGSSGGGGGGATGSVNFIIKATS
ncbi:MAG: hypothetical protein IJD57_04095 [Candidatus Gastranaerophilales bacterium]|nr:hypothetical protein [Candidatus Gastranaerophilales bacterium]